MCFCVLLLTGCVHHIHSSFHRSVRHLNRSTVFVGGVGLDSNNISATADDDNRRRIEIVRRRVRCRRSSDIAKVRYGWQMMMVVIVMVMVVHMMRIRRIGCQQHRFEMLPIEAAVERVLDQDCDFLAIDLVGRCECELFIERIGG